MLYGWNSISFRQTLDDFSYHTFLHHDNIIPYPAFCYRYVKKSITNTFKNLILIISSDDKFYICNS